jgi:hypothetical protein
LEQAAQAMLRALGGGRAALLMTQTMAATPQSGLGVAALAVTETEMEPVLLQAQPSGTPLLAIATAATLRRALGGAELSEVQMIQMLQGAMLRAGETQYRIAAVTVKRFGGSALLYELEIEA